MFAIYLFLPIVAIATFAVSRAIRRTNNEAHRLNVALRDLAQLRPAMVEVRTEAERAHQSYRQIRRR